MLLLRLDRRLPTGSAPAINLVVECVLQLAGWNALLRDRVLTGCSAGHPAAAFGTFAADSGAVFHPLDLLAALRAGLADFSTNFADPLGESRTAQHEVGRGLAHLRAVQHEAEMVGRDMLTARFQAMVHCFVQTCLMASSTAIDA